MQGYSNSAAMITSGVIGGVFGAAASHPFDTVKTRMQVCTWGVVVELVGSKVQGGGQGGGWRPAGDCHC